MHRQGKYLEAIKQYKRSLASKDEFRKRQACIRHIAIAYYEAKDFQLAKEWALKTISAGEITPHTLYLLGMCQFNCKEFDGALDSFSTALSKGFDKTKISVMLFRCKLNQNKLSDAKHIVNTLCEDNMQKEIGNKLKITLAEKEKEIRSSILKTLNDETKFAKTNHHKTYKQAVKAAKRGDWDAAEILYTQALGKKKNNVQYLSELCAVQTYLCKTNEAIKTGNEARRLDKNHIGAMINLSLAYRNNFENEKAIKLLNDALIINPNNSIALSNKTAILHRLGEYDLALQTANKYFKNGFDSSDIRNNIANIYLVTGQKDKAEAESRKSLVLDKTNVMARVTLSKVLVSKRQYKEAIDRLIEGIKLSPLSPDLYLSASNILAYTDSKDLMYEMAKKAKALNTANNVSILIQISIQYRKAGRMTEAATISRELANKHTNDPTVLQAHALTCSMIQLNDEAKKYYKLALELFNDPTLRSQYLFNLAYQSWGDGYEFRREAEKYGALISKNAEKIQLEDIETKGHSKFRIGFLSGDLRGHSVSFFMHGLLLGLKELNCETIAFSTYTTDETVTTSLEAKFSEWYDVEELRTKELGQLIKNSQLDVLVDLSGHTEFHRLEVLALKPCKDIYHYLGFPGTTGVNEIDYFIGDRQLLPEESHKFFTEKLAILDRGYLAYTPPANCPPVRFKKDLFEGDSRILYGSFNNPRKINKQTQKIWAKVLSADKSARIVFKSSYYEDEGFKKGFMASLISYGIEEYQMIFLPGIPDQSKHLDIYNGIHVSLDTVGFTGGTTTCDALWMGVPIITLPGIEMKTRISSSIIHSAGCSEFIATNALDYVQIAQKTAIEFKNDPNLKIKLHQKVKNSDLCDASGLAQSMVNLFKHGANKK